MNDLSTLARVLALMGDALGLPASDVKPDVSLREQGFDSLDCIELAMEIEDHFSISLGDDDDGQIELKQTPQDVAALVDAELAKKIAAPTEPL